MSIKLKYDPVGSSAMAAYDSGLGAGKERRDVRQQTFDLMEDRNNLIGGKRGGGFGGMPAGVAANPIAAKAWNEANNGIRMIENGRTFDTNIPSTAIAHGRLADRKRQIEEANPDPKPAEARAKQMFLGDAMGNPVAAGTPGAINWWDPGDGKMPTPMAAPKPKDEAGKVILDMKVKAIRDNSEIPNDGDPIDPAVGYVPTKEDRIRKLYEEAGAAAPVAPGAAPVAGAAPPVAGGGTAINDARPLPEGFDAQTWINETEANIDIPFPNEIQRQATKDRLAEYPEYAGLDLSKRTDRELAQLGIDHWKRRIAAQPAAGGAAPAPGAPAAATGMGANPTPENTYPSPREGETPLQSAAHYQQWADQLRKGRRPIRPAARGGFLADFMRRHPTWDPTKVTDLQIMDELVWAYMNVARKAVSGYGEDSPEGNPAAMIGSGSTPLPTAAPPPAAGGTGAAPAAQPPMRNSGKAVEQDNRPQSVIVADKYLRRMRGMYGQNIPPEEAQAFQNAMSVLEAYESQL